MSSYFNSKPRAQQYYELSLGPVRIEPVSKRKREPEVKQEQ